MTIEPATTEHESPLKLAAFDFDGTLARRDTLMGFLAKATSPLKVAVALASQAPSVLRDRSDRDGPKTAVLRRLLQGDDPSRLEALGAEYATQIRRLLRPEMLERVEWHKAQGHRLVMVSASLLYYLVPLAGSLGFDHVIAVDFEVGADGRLTGNLASPNVRGPEKSRRLREWLEQTVGEMPSEMWAYGDSSGDDELLAMADHPMWVGRRATSRAPSATVR